LLLLQDIYSNNYIEDLLDGQASFWTSLGRDSTKEGPE